VFLGNRDIFLAFLPHVVLLCVILCGTSVLAQSSTIDEHSAISKNPVVETPHDSTASDKNATEYLLAKTTADAKNNKADISPTPPPVESKNDKAEPIKAPVKAEGGEAKVPNPKAITVEKKQLLKSVKAVPKAETMPKQVSAAPKPTAFKKAKRAILVKSAANKAPAVRQKRAVKKVKRSRKPKGVHLFHQAMLSEWSKYEKYREKKDWKGVEKSLENIFIKQMQAGMTSQRTLSAALVLDAEDESLKNNHPGAVLLLKYAKKISLNYSIPYFASAKTVFLNHPIHVFTWAKDLFTGVLKNMEGFQGKVLLSRFLVLVFSLALLVTFFVFSILQVVKKHSFILHDISEYFPSLLPSVKKLLVVVFVSLPIFTMSIFWFISYEILLFFRYMSRRERAVSIVFFLFLALTPYILNFLAGSLILEGKPAFWVVSSSIEKGWYPNIKDFDDKNSQAAYSVRFLLALAAKKGGDFDRANVIWDELASTKFEPYRVLVGYGNTYFAQKNFPKAAKLYNKSLAYSTKPLLSLYNLSQTYSSSFIGEEASRLYTEAMGIDIKKVESFDIMGKIPGFNTAVVDSSLPTKYFFGIANKLVGDFSKTSEFLSESLFRWVGLANYQLLALIFMAICFVWGSIARDRLPRLCDTCGNLCTTCSGAISQGTCNECFAAFEKKNKAHSRVQRILKMKIHNEKKSYISYGISVFLPGGGHIYEGELFLGLGLLFVSTLFVSGWFFKGLILGSQAISLHISGMVFFLMLIPFFAMYMLVLWDIRLKTKI